MVSLKCKELLCLFYSGILFLSGVFLIGFSIILSYKLFQHFKFIPSDTMGPFILILGLGFIHLLLTWLGIKGPTKQHDFHIIMFVIFSAALFFAEIGTGIWGLTLKYNLGYKIERILNESLSQNIKNDYDKKEWMILESKIHCCGVNGIADYKEKGTFPLSCCSNEIPFSNANCAKIYEDGCLNPFRYSVDSILLQITLSGFVSGLYQVLGVISFYLFYKHLREERKSRSTLRRQSRIYSSTNRPQPLNPESQSNQPNIPATVS